MFKLIFESEKISVRKYEKLRFELELKLFLGLEKTRLRIGLGE